MLNIRKAHLSDAEDIWDIIREVITAGDTYTFDPQTPKEKMLAYWLAPDKHTYVAESDNRIVGTFIIKDNQPDLGSHVANAGYMTAPHAFGQGIGRKMCAFSLEEAKRLGYLAMQFNIVIKSNERAVKLWQQMGFSIIGEIPEAFQHQSLGLTNAYIMYRKL
ncbi:MAG: GNAT family N-acetyltransferase [Saprospiraceae bacterium]|nr:GNAT family N-acetyltransferase [Saprospiraceae bacterium]